MPIANCIINPQLTPGHSDPIHSWAQQADVWADLLTINFIQSDNQLGVRYDAMATIQLPTAWSRQQASAIQLALASALEEYFSVSPAQIHVVTQWVESGLAVENGELQHW